MKQHSENRQENLNEAEEITLRLAQNVTHESILVLKYGPHILDELDGLSRAKQSFDVILINLGQAGFLFPSLELISCASIAKSLLAIKGALVFLKHDKAAAFVKESPIGHLSFHMWETFSEVYDYSTIIAKHIQQAMGQNIEIQKDSANLSEQILLTAIPILSNFGIKLKAGMEGSKRRNLVLSAIDNYTPLNTINQRLSQMLSFEQLLEELKQLERTGAIYPIFPKIPFLVHNFRNGRPFKLGQYLLEARLLTQEQLDDVIHTMQHAKGAQRLSIGAVCVAKGLFSARELEIALQDQAFFGQQQERDKSKLRAVNNDTSGGQSLIGNLSTTEPAGVLQNLANNRCTGVLSVEFKDYTFRAAFEQGKITFAKQGKINGNLAVIEFVSTWKDGVFVFLERPAPSDLANELNQITKPLDKLLLDSALATDQIEAIWASISQGPKSILERYPDTYNWLSSGQLTDPTDGYILSEYEIDCMQRIWQICDGISQANEIIKKLQNIPTIHAATAISRLIHYSLLGVPAVNLSTPLSRFRAILAQVTEHIGHERSNALLRIALRETSGYTAVARIFQIGSGSEIGADMNAAKAANLSLSMVVKALEDWQVKYLEHSSQEMDKNKLREIVYKVHQGRQ